jgi:hypothetical protein
MPSTPAAERGEQYPASLLRVSDLEDRAQLWWDWWRASGQEPVARLLREQWNPIGDDELPADEYSSYATRIGGLLREGVSEDQLTTWLSDARTGAMGLPADTDEDSRVAQLLHEWYAEARRDHEA